MKLDGFRLLIGAVIMVIIGLAFLRLIPILGIAVLLIATMAVAYWVSSGISNIIQEDETEPEELDPQEDLRRRYARGEISDEEFERRLDALMDSEHLDERQREEEMLLR